MSFSSSPLMESFPPTRFTSPEASPTRTEVDLPIEVDNSFNSSMSISGSPCLSPTSNMSKPFASPAMSSDGFLSPTPAFSLRPRRPDPVPIQARKSSQPAGLGLQCLGSGRAFGREISHTLNHTASTSRSPSMSDFVKAKGRMLPPAVPAEPRGFKRGGLPMQWSSSNEVMAPKTFGTSMDRHETDPLYGISPRSACSGDMGMDVDSPAISARKGSVAHSPAFSGAASFSGSPGLGDFFCDSPVAPALPPAKRRSLVTGSPASPSGSPSAKRASLSRNMEKTASSSAMLFGAGRASTIGTRRAQPYKRPTLLPVPPMDAVRPASAFSANPVLYQPKPMVGSLGTFPRVAVAPMRRAFSVCDQPPTMPEMSEDESEYEASPSMVAPGGHARKPAVRLPRLDGSPGHRGVRASIAGTGQGVVSPAGSGLKASPFGSARGLPGFGDNEMDGKILPCRKVTEDGLVRITPDTLDDLISGTYSDRIKRYHILDCRFDYEYAGGHVAGAINVKSIDMLDELLLSPELGVHEGGDALPAPSRSGELPEGEQVVLVFHCEFSAKRAPTFAKALRSRDRTINGAHYPKIYYPEVYILEGGYCGFYQSRPERCEPKGYIPMDDPKHFERRNSDLHDFRKFTRTKSYTYGETQPPPPARTALPCPPLAFAAASAAIGRRHGPPSAMITEEEQEHDSSSSPSAPGKDEASPCARALNLGSAPIFGSAKTRTLGRVGFTRVASYAGPGSARP